MVTNNGNRIAEFHQGRQFTPTAGNNIWGKNSKIFRSKATSALPEDEISSGKLETTGMQNGCTQARTETSATNPMGFDLSLPGDPASRPMDRTLHLTDAFVRATKADEVHAEDLS
jgi:hypothetical protein